MDHRPETIDYRQTKKPHILFKRSIVYGLLSLVLFSAMARKPQNFPVTVIIDFGPAGKPRVEQKVEVETGTTAKDAVSIVLPIRSGKSCCSVREVIEIDGVRVDPKNERWWICLLNGSKKFSPRTKELKPNDKIEWKYIETK